MRAADTGTERRHRRKGRRVSGRRTRARHGALAAVAGLTAVALAATALLSVPATAQETVEAEVQLRPGGPQKQVQMEVHEVPVDPRSVPASEVQLEDDELVLGLVRDGEAVAYPIRFLAKYEVVNDRVGETAVAPSW